MNKNLPMNVDFDNLSADEFENYLSKFSSSVCLGIINKINDVRKKSHFSLLFASKFRRKKELVKGNICRDIDAYNWVLNVSVRDIKHFEDLIGKFWGLLYSKLIDRAIERKNRLKEKFAVNINNLQTT